MSSEITLPKTTYTAENGQLTVGELMKILETIVSKNPEAKDAPVSHVEFGGVTPTRILETGKYGVILAQY